MDPGAPDIDCEYGPTAKGESFENLIPSSREHLSKSAWLRLSGGLRGQENGLHI
jgi:hypothetical protein